MFDTVFIRSVMVAAKFAEMESAADRRGSIYFLANRLVRSAEIGHQTFKAPTTSLSSLIGTPMEKMPVRSSSSPLNFGSRTA